MSDTAYTGDRARIYVRLADLDLLLLMAMQNLNGAASSATRGDHSITVGWSESAVLLLKND